MECLALYMIHSIFQLLCAGLSTQRILRPQTRCQRIRAPHLDVFQVVSHIQLSSPADDHGLCIGSRSHSSRITHNVDVAGRTRLFVVDIRDTWQISVYDLLNFHRAAPTQSFFLNWKSWGWLKIEIKSV